MLLGKHAIVAHARSIIPRVTIHVSMHCVGILIWLPCRCLTFYYVIFAKRCNTSKVYALNTLIYYILLTVYINGIEVSRGVQKSLQTTFPSYSNAKSTLKVLLTFNTVEKTKHKNVRMQKLNIPNNCSVNLPVTFLLVLSFVWVMA